MFQYEHDIGAGEVRKYRQLKVFRLIGNPGKRLRLQPVIERNENNRSIEF